MPAFASRQGSKHHLDGENKKLEGRWAFFQRVTGDGGVCGENKK